MQQCAGWMLSFMTLLVCSAAVARQAADDGVRPNVVLVMCDDLGWGDVGFHGNRVIATPNLDAMAAAGLRFERFYAAAPVCSPTRGSCLTGRHPYRYGIWGANAGHMPAEELTLAEMLRAEGYATGMFGKWHLGTLTKSVRDSNRGGPRGAAHFAPPAQHGFDVCFVTEAKVPTCDPLRLPAGGRRLKAWDALLPDQRWEVYGTRYWDQQGHEVQEGLEGDDSQLVMDRATAFIQGCATQEKKFLAVIWLHAPHLPVVAAADWRARYAKYDEHTRNYYGCITALDAQLGRLREALVEAGVAEETMLWFCSDNGPEGRAGPGSAGPFRGRKRSLYEGGVRVPAFVWWPGKVEAGGKTDVPAVTSDFLPTLADVLGISLEGQLDDEGTLDGESLLPLIEGKAWRRAQAIGFQTKRRVAWNGERFKLIGARDAEQFELYDLVSDPAETTDVAADHEDIVKTMRAELAAWMASCARSAASIDVRRPATPGAARRGRTGR